MGERVADVNEVGDRPFKGGHLVTIMEPKTIPALLKFPYPWPPSNPMLLLAQGAPYFTLQVCGLTDGHIKVLIKYPGGKERDLEYQKVAIPNAGHAMMILLLDKDKVNLYLNGESLLLRQDAKGKVRHVNVSEALAERALHLDLPDEHAVHNEDEWLFIRSLGDLAHKISTGDKYDILQATLPLRKLLLDEQPLVNIGNRSYKKQLRPSLPQR